MAIALEGDDAAELIYRDWLRFKAAAGNRPGLHTAISRLQQINKALDCSSEPETEQLINDLLNGPHGAAQRSVGKMAQLEISWRYGAYRRSEAAEEARAAWVDQRIYLAWTKQWTP